MKTIEYIFKTTWHINRNMFCSKRFQGLVFSIDFDVPQGMWKTVCVFTVKIFFVGAWFSLEKKTIMIPGLSKYKSGGLIGGSTFKKSNL